jgi:hypothetical protein
MNLRELLEFKLWSNEANWKILSVLSVSVFLCVTGFLGWNQIELHWLTSGERTAARAVLAEIDSLEDADLLSDREWKARTEQAQVKMNAAEAVAKTYRDNFLGTDLRLYLVEVETDHANLQRRAVGKRELQLQAIIGKSTKDLRLALHKELD